MFDLVEEFHRCILVFIGENFIPDRSAIQWLIQFLHDFLILF